MCVKLLFAVATVPIPVVTCCDLSCKTAALVVSVTDRGGLTWPTDLLISIVAQCKCLVSEQHATVFNLAHNQRAITAAMALQRCVTVLDISGKCPGCSVP